MEVLIRPRVEADLPACVDLLADVHREDGYPVRWPDDPVRWLRPKNLLDAWVAEAGGRLAGHATLRGAAGTSAADSLAAATGEPAGRICMLARLFVAPTARRQGIAARFVEVAEAAAAERDLLLGLDVVASDRAAVALYERSGWRRVATLPWSPMPDGEPQELHCYLAPER